MSGLSMFEGVTSLLWQAGNDPDVAERKARAALAATGQPQGVHFHGPDDDCVRGGRCYVLRLPGYVAPRPEVES